MNRKFTNTIRWCMDELLPPVLRDNYFFMFPFFFYWFKGKKLKLYMEYKDLVPAMTEEDIRQVYRALDCRAKDRDTDLSDECLQYILSHLHPEGRAIADVGCGQGYFLKMVERHWGGAIGRYGIDLIDKPRYRPAFAYINAELASLPLSDQAVDIVTCFHTLEHLRDPLQALAEIKRIAGKQVIVVVPRQRYYHYTLDLHLHFFPTAGSLSSLIGMPDFSCVEVAGDWVYIGYPEQNLPANHLIPKR